MLSLRERTTFRPEEGLLVCCARPCGDPQRAEAITALLDRQIDWSYLLHIAGWHGMMPLLYKHLNATCPEAIPEQILGQLRDYFRDNAVRNLFLTQELLKLLQLFAANDIPAIPFKGPVLASSLYGDVCLRMFEDLDILVHKRDVPSARRLLVSQRYRPQFQLSDEQERVHIKLRNALSFARVDRSVLVDLHWNITPPILQLAPDPERLWERGEAVWVFGREIRTFSPEDLLLILCVHGTKHYWAWLSWISDIAFFVVRHNDMDWDQALNQASSHGSERMLLLGLLLATELLGTVPPNEVLKKLENRTDVTALANQVGKNLFRNLDVPSRRFEGYMFYSRAMDRFVDRLRQSYLELAPTPLEWVLLPLPRYLSPFYYLLRPVRLLSKYILRLITNISVRTAKGS